MKTKKDIARKLCHYKKIQMNHKNLLIQLLVVFLVLDLVSGYDYKTKLQKYKPSTMQKITNWRENLAKSRILLLF